MSERAIRPMSVAEFLRWEDGTDARYELVGGFPVAMAPPAEAHRILATRLASRIDGALASRAAVQCTDRGGRNAAGSRRFVLHR